MGLRENNNGEVCVCVCVRKCNPLPTLPPKWLPPIQGESGKCEILEITREAMAMQCPGSYSDPMYQTLLCVQLGVD